MNMKRNKTLQTGSVLLEALISILIFSIGILALVGMQATAINGVSDAKYRSTAGFLANQMVGTIWATRLGGNVANASNVMAASPDPAFQCNPAPYTCTSANGNAYTQAWAASSVAADLPNATARIKITGAEVTVSILWQPPKEAALIPPPLPHRHVVQTYIN